jgi:hypothetical protein
MSHFNLNRFEAKKKKKKKFNSIPLSSMEPQRVFSGCGRTVAKIRSSLHYESVGY